MTAARINAVKFGGALACEIIGGANAATRAADHRARPGIADMLEIPSTAGRAPSHTAGQAPHPGDCRAEQPADGGQRHAKAEHDVLAIMFTRAGGFSCVEQQVTRLFPARAKNHSSSRPACCCAGSQRQVFHIDCRAARQPQVEGRTPPRRGRDPRPSYRPQKIVTSREHKWPSGCIFDLPVPVEVRIIGR